MEVGNTTDEGILSIVPFETKMFFIFVFALICFIIFIVIATHTFFILISYLFEKVSECLEDVKDFFTRKSNYEDHFKSSGKRKGVRWYEDKINKQDDSDDEEDSDDEVVKQYWDMVQENNTNNNPDKIKHDEEPLQAHLGMAYHHKNGEVACSLLKIRGFKEDLMEKYPWKNSNGVFVRFLLLTKDGLILKKENSKIKKSASVTSDEIIYNEHYNFEIPLCQINNVVLLVTLFVIHRQNLNETLEEKTEQSHSNLKSIKTPIFWMSFGANPSSPKTHDHWSLMVQTADEIRNWHNFDSHA